MESLFAPSVNLLILVGFLFIKLKQPTKDFVASRHKAILNDVQSVKNQLKSSQEKYDEFSAKLKSIDAELAILREQAKADAAALKQRVITESRRIAGNMVMDSRAAGDALYNELRSQLYSDLSQSVLGRAEHILKERLTGDDRERIRLEFSRQVESIQ